MQGSNKRWNYFVNKEVQLRFTAWLVLISLLTSLQLLAYLALLDGNIIERAAKFGLTSNDVTVSFILVEHKEMLIKLVVCLIANMLLVGLFGLFYSHRIAGPIYRVEKFLTRVAEGDLSGTVKLRKHDQFQNLATTINLMLDCLRQKRRDELSSLRSLEKQIQAMGGKNHDALKIMDSLCRQCEADLFSNNPTQKPSPETATVKAIAS